ncbi:MAG: hypothetical protein GC160_22165 [Acidobacteria bacterium]|nr:hypothetical protein [Acidobacteriota bacterium]
MKKNLALRISISILAFLALGLPLSAQLTQVATTNAASFSAQFPLAPGCWATSFGDFASMGVTTASFADAVPFPTTLGGVQVFVNDAAAPMSYVGPTQINFLVPKGTPEGRMTLRITVSGMNIYEGSLQVFPISPGLLSINPGDVAKPGAILNQDGTLNSEQNPAAPGEVIVAYGIGADFSELPDDGAPAPSDRLINTSSDTTVYVSVAEAEVLFSGLAPTLVNAWQLNVTVPDVTFVDGQVTLQAEVSGLKTNAVSFWVAR